MESKQNKTTFHVDDVGPGHNHMTKVDPMKLRFIKKTVKAISSNDPIYDLGDHPVLRGYEMAYKNHLPIIISPDIIWTLILQGFALHVQSNSEKLRTSFVDFDGKKKLEIQREDLNFFTITVDQIQSLFPLIVNFGAKCYVFVVMEVFMIHLILMAGSLSFTHIMKRAIKWI